MPGFEVCAGSDATKPKHNPTSSRRSDRLIGNWIFRGI